MNTASAVAGYAGTGAGRAWWVRCRPGFCLEAPLGLPDDGVLTIDLSDASLLALSWPAESPDSATYARLVGSEAFEALREACAGVGNVAAQEVTWGVNLDVASSGPLVRAAVVEGVARWCPGALDPTGLLIDRMVAAHVAGWSDRARMLAQLVAPELADLAAQVSSGDLPSSLAGGLSDGVEAALAVLDEPETHALLTQARTMLRAASGPHPQLDDALARLLTPAGRVAHVMGDKDARPRPTPDWERDERADLAIRPGDLPARIVAFGAPHDRDLHVVRRVGQSVVTAWAPAHPDVDALDLQQVELQVHDRETGALLAAEPVTLDDRRICARAFLAGRTLRDVRVSLRAVGGAQAPGDPSLVLAERCMYAAWWTLRQGAIARALGTPSDPLAVRREAQAYLEDAMAHLRTWAAGSAEAEPDRDGVWALLDQDPGPVSRPTLAELLGAVRRALARGGAQ